MVVAKVCLLIAFASWAIYALESTTTGPTAGSSTTAVPSTTPSNASSVCAKHNECETCVKEGAKCVWCTPTDTCMVYDTKKILPQGCPKKDWYLGQCLMSGMVLVIAVPLVAFFLLFCCCCCVYCKCCRDKEGWKRIESKMAARQRDREDRNMERKLDRQRRNDEVRKKYGLLKNQDA